MIFQFLKECANYYKNNKIKEFILHVSTDEVYGSLNLRQKSFTEKNKYLLIVLTHQVKLVQI